MVEKKGRGLPVGFDLDLNDKPTRLGDLLEEEDAIRDQTLSALSRERQPEPAEPRPVVVSQGLKARATEVAPLVVREELLPTPTPTLAPPATLQEAAGASSVGVVSLHGDKKLSSLHPAWKRPRRKQLNLSPEGEARLEEVLAYFRDFGPQSDIRMSEIFEALVLLAHESRERLSIADLPKRGAWGSPTERNFPVLIARALGEAITRMNSEWAKAANAS